MATGNAGAGNVDGSNNIYDIVLLIVDIVMLVVKFWLAIIESTVKLFVPGEKANVNGQVVLITGTGHGMGKEMALQYAALGAKVVCWDINEVTNNKTVDEIKKAGGVAWGYVCNVTKRDEVMQLSERVRKEVGFVNIVINNAGIMPTHPLLEHTEQETRLLFDINVLGNFWVSEVNRMLRPIS